MERTLALSTLNLVETCGLRSKQYGFLYFRQFDSGVGGCRTTLRNAVQLKLINGTRPIKFQN